MRERFEQRSDLSRVTPGQFQTSRDGQRVFFIERASEDGRDGRNVFILSRQGDSESVTSARSGHIENTPEASFLVLDRGQRNEQDLKTSEKTVARFESYRVQAGERAMRNAENLPHKAQRTIELLRGPEPRAQGELTWRLGLTLGAANLLLLGIGLSATQPRRASNWNMLFALLAFVIYYNMINLTKAWVAGGKMGMGLALVMTHGAALTLAVGLLWWRDHGTNMPRWPGLRTARKAAA
jgi:lipopolysaccharide export system permease protein